MASLDFKAQKSYLFSKGKAKPLVFDVCDLSTLRPYIIIHSLTHLEWRLWPSGRGCSMCRCQCPPGHTRAAWPCHRCPPPSPWTPGPWPWSLIGHWVASDWPAQDSMARAPRPWSPGPWPGPPAAAPWGDPAWQWGSSSPPEQGQSHSQTLRLFNVKTTFDWVSVCIGNILLSIITASVWCQYCCLCWEWLLPRTLDPQPLHHCDPPDAASRVSSRGCCVCSWTRTSASLIASSACPHCSLLSSLTAVFSHHYLQYWVFITVLTMSRQSRGLLRSACWPGHCDAGDDVSIISEYYHALDASPLSFSSARSWSPLTV